MLRQSLVHGESPERFCDLVGVTQVVPGSPEPESSPGEGHPWTLLISPSLSERDGSIVPGDGALEKRKYSHFPRIAGHGL